MKHVQIRARQGSELLQGSAIVFLTKSEWAEKKETPAVSAHLRAVMGDQYRTLLEGYHFTAAASQAVLHVGMQSGQPYPIVIVGLGAGEGDSSSNLETFRRSFGKGLATLAGTEVSTVDVLLPSASFCGLSEAEFVRQATILAHLALYNNVSFKSKKEGAWEPAVTFSGVVVDGAVTSALAQGNLFGDALTVTRNLADTPPNYLTPLKMAEKAHELAGRHANLTLTHFDQEKAREMGMGCFYSVAKGSINPGQFVMLSYKGEPVAGEAVTIALVGKGVCFDSGGNSLKPASAMSGMKYDMSGAAAVYAVMDIIATLKPRGVNVVGVTPLVENMPGWRASKQDDVVVALNGTTVEIDNTDAEGRLILADAVTYVQREARPAIMIDIATLTGACMHALGHFFSGMMTRDEQLSSELLRIGRAMGDPVWRMPLTDDYKPALKSKIADIHNGGSSTYKAGATTAALFIEHFVEKGVRWAHLDIAGTDSGIPDSTYYGRGATGVGVRLLAEFVLSHAK